MVLDIAAPVAGLPVGPATEATVKANLKLVGVATDDATLTLNINAVNQLVCEWRVVTDWLATLPTPLPDPAPAWPESIVLGCTLLASRWFRRGNSPAGVINLGGESGVAYVQRNDPDIGMMLGLGAYKKPQVG